MDDGFYRAFEDRYRGSRELITERLRVYLPFLDPLKDLYQDYPILDLGCGRGEWLELLQREGYAPMGVDLDEGMLQACQARGLPARNADALTALRELPDNSLIAVTGFHIAEHIPFPILQEVVAEAQRVLRPAGLLILETPNAESLVVGTNTFYLDPTHERPLPGLLLSFLAEHSGFAKTKIVRLQERTELRAEDQKIGLWDVISGTSPDYAVVGQKNADSEHLKIFLPAFEARYGVSLDDLALRFDDALQRRLTRIEGELTTFHQAVEMQEQRLEERLDEQEQRFNASINRLQQNYSELHSNLDEVHGTHSSTLQQLEMVRVELNASFDQAHQWYLRAVAYEQQLHEMRHSTFWRITAPFRWSVHTARRAPRATVQTIGNTARKVLVVGVHFVLARPMLRQRLNNVLKRSPRFYTALRSVVHNHGMMADAAMVSSPPPDSPVPAHLEGLSVEARQVYHDLKKAIDQKDLG